MKTQAEILVWYRRRRRFLSLVVTVIAIMVWIGWYLDLQSLTAFVKDYPPMSPLSALAVAILAVVVFQPSWVPKGFLLTCAMSVGLMSFALVFFAVIGSSEFPGTIKQVVDGSATIENNFAPLTPLMIALLSVVGALQYLGRGMKVRQTITIIILFTLYLIFIGHMTQAEYVRSFAFFSYVSIPAEVTMFLLSLSMLYRERQEGVMSLLTSPTEGGIVARQLMIFVLLSPAITTASIHWSVRHDLMQSSFGSAINVAVNVMFFEIFVWRLGHRLRLTEEAKLLAEAEIIIRQQQLEMFKKATDSSTEAVIMTDTRGDIFYVNAAWERITGWKLREARGKNPRILQSGKTNPAIYKKLWKALTAGKSFTSDEIINRRKDGREYDAELHIYPVRQSKNKVIYVGLEQDITDRKAMDRAKTEFVSIASHQLATPLTSMRWTLELLSTTKPFQAKQRHYLDTIAMTNLRMIALVNALLNTSRVDVGSFMIMPQMIDVAKEIKSMVDEVAADSAKKRLTVKLQSTNRRLSYSADPTLLRIIIQNLLTNAIRYTPDGGKITISYILDDQWLSLSVSDTGIGIPSNEQEKIFQKMHRAQNAIAAVPNGTGLGLYIVKAIVNHSGGTITFDSAIDKGTTFVVRWPASGWKSRTGNRELSYQAQNQYTT
jgi:PAS domain S-box-containing protein